MAPPPVSCARCGETVLMIGGFVKLGARYLHIDCFKANHELEVRNKIKQEELEAAEAERARRAEAERLAKIAADAKRRAETEAALQLQIAKAQADAAVAATIANERARAAQFAPKPASTPSVSEAGERRLDIDDAELLEAAALKRAEEERKEQERKEIQEREAKAKAMLAGTGVQEKPPPKLECDALNGIRPIELE